MEQFKLSKRLHTVAHLVKKDHIVADIGTDHGYLPIYLVKSGIAKRVIAMDVRKGPLEKAKHNIETYQVKEQIDIRLSDGLEKLTPNEADTVTICGMGGRLIQSILTNGIDKIGPNTQLIVSPQSEISEFRAFLAANGFVTEQEHMLKEDHQFYLIMECRLRDRALFGKMTDSETKDNSMSHSNDSVQSQVDLRYGRTLLEKSDLCLYEYLQHEKQINDKVFEKLNEVAVKDAGIQKRIEEITFDRSCIERALEYYTK